MLSAHNLAYDLIETELNICVDSDDYLSFDAIDKILKHWDKISHNGICGIIAYNINSENKIIGNKFPSNVDNATLYDLYNQYELQGDKKLVYKTNIIQNYRYRMSKKEKNIPTTYIYFQIDKKYNLSIMKEAICVVEYQENGLSKSEQKRLVDNPFNSSLYFNLCLSLENNFSKKILITAKYIIFSLMAKNRNFIKECNEKKYIIPALPIALGGYLFIYRKYNI